MKRVLSLLLLLLLLFGGCAAPNGQDEPQPTQEPSRPVETIRAVWLTCYELNAMLRRPGEAAFREAFGQAVQRCAAGEINTLFVQVRPFCDAFYPSERFDWSSLCADRNGDPPSFDPLAVMVELAHQQGLSLHAWVNPYRVSYDSLTEWPERLAAYRTCVGQTETGTWFDPSQTAVRSLILDGMREILQNYAVDGIHIDDYFYPTAAESFDRQSYAEACALGNERSLADWRREQVNLLLRGAYALVKSFGADKIFSVSPSGDLTKNREEAFADAAAWLAQGGMADWVIPQIYFGFLHEKKPFEAVVNQWETLPRHESVRLLCGLAAYKQGKEDAYAGAGRGEWTEDADVLTRQIAFICADEAWSGYSLFSYDACGF